MGAKLARDDGGSACIHFEWATAIASKLSSHRSDGVPGCAGCPQSPVGAKLARDDGGSACIILNGLPLSRASSAPTGPMVCLDVPIAPNPLWEPSLLAMTVGQRASILNLLTGPVVCLDVPVAPNPLWERACSRWRSIRHSSCEVGPTPLRPATASARPSTARGPGGRPGRPRGC